ncbi:hypothetical protein ACTXJ3_10445 [Brachybacterium paraconglomeratum]|uniref:hypothetical protein n=1 Tax=Brachybacterium paraconglomeratum TaxID=173362 RepID=UPI003FD4D088
MITSLPARTTIFLIVLVALVIGAFVFTSGAPAPVEGGIETVKYGTTDQLTPEERELLESDTPKSVVVDARTGDIVSLAVDADG